MRKLFFVTMSLVFLLGIGGIANATNGDNFIAVGPIGRSMGGVGIAAPQDSISAVFANPAGMCFGPYCPSSQLDFGGTIFLPTAHGRIEVPAAGININDRSQSNIFLVPAIGLSTPISSDSTSFFSRFRFGLAAYGSSGMGVDYRERLLFPQPGTDIFTQYSVFKFAPNLAYRITDNLSVGVNFQLDYTALDLGAGTSSGFGFGGQIGAIYKIGPVSFGLSYVSPQTVNHKKVSDFNGDTLKDNLKLEMPQTVGFGIAYETPGKLLLKDDRLLIEGDFKWINWANARGYKDFDWRDQYVFAFGAQYKPIPKLSLRAGVNYGQNPVKTHNGFDAGAGSFTNVQGKSVPTFQYEYLRILGFPALVETHLTCGIGYEFSERFGVNIGYTHGFAKSISETGVNFGPGMPATLGAKLAEDSIDFGLSWRF
jgi:long-chain fatty acid transport protein